MSFFNFWDYSSTNPSPTVVKSITKPSYLQDNTSLANSVTFDDLYKIVIVLDESGSMNSIRGQIIKSINDLILEQKQIKERPATFTLVKFNDNVNRIIVNKLLTNVQTISYSDYNPSGSTALYDAIGNTIDWFKNEKNVLMVIVTDGQENASKKYTRYQINKMIDEKKEKSDWTYVYLSSDLSTEVQGNNLGLHKSKYASNCVVDQNKYGDFIGSSLNSAITNCRQKGVSVQDQLR